MKKTIYFCLAVCFLFACENNKCIYIAECSYYVNGELITSNGGGVGCFIDHTASPYTLVTYNTATAISHLNVNSVIEDKDNRIAFHLIDWIGDGSQRHFDVQNQYDEQQNRFYVEYLKLIYKGKEYRAISGFIDLEITGNFINSSSPYKEEVAFQASFEAVMVNAKDTLYVTNGSCYYSWMEYGELR